MLRLMVYSLCCPAMLLIAGQFLCSSDNESRTAQQQRHRSPIDVAVLPDSKRALTANFTSGSMSLVNLDTGKVLMEMPCDPKPSGIACSPDGTKAAVSHLWSGAISFISIEKDKLRREGKLAAGVFPRGAVFARDSKSIFVACGGSDEVVHVHWSSKKVLHRWQAPREPRQLALSPDGRWLAAASSRSGEVRVWDLRTNRLHWHRSIPDAFNLRRLAFTPDGKDLICAHVVRREFPVAKDNIEKGWVTDSRLTKLTLQKDALPFSWQIALDVQGQAVGDPHGLALTNDGRWLAVAASGTHELLLLRSDSLPWNPGDPGDFLHDKLQANKELFRRVELGGRPLSVARAGNHLVIANYLNDSLQIVNAEKGKLLRSVSLGRPAKISLARRGEALFYDARRSHNQWFSCHTCHTDGHTSGMLFDTLNDDSFGNPKLTPSLRNVTKTGPWTWHGWQKDLGAAFVKSSTQTMFGKRPPTKNDTAAMLAFLQTLAVPPNPNREKDGSLIPAAQRGKALFHGKARCDRCHSGPYYTSNKNVRLTIEPGNSPYELWNVPSLSGLFDRGHYFHDGRAKTLDDVLRKHQLPKSRQPQALTVQEKDDLIQFLKSI